MSGDYTLIIRMYSFFIFLQFIHRENEKKINVYNWKRALTGLRSGTCPVWVCSYFPWILKKISPCLCCTMKLHKHHCRSSRSTELAFTTHIKSCPPHSHSILRKCCEKRTFKTLNYDPLEFCFFKVSDRDIHVVPELECPNRSINGVLWQRRQCMRSTGSLWHRS